MSDHFRNLRLPAEQRTTRRDEEWERDVQSQERRNAVLHALQAAMHDALVARALRRMDPLPTQTEDEFNALHWDPIWDGLRDSLTRQDLLRWLIDWAQSVQEERALGSVVRLREELEMLDDDSGSWWLTENPG